MEALVRKGSQPKAATTPLYVTELNANWAYAVDGLRNDPTYGPSWNSAALTDLLNVVYNGAQAGSEARSSTSPLPGSISFCLAVTATMTQETTLAEYATRSAAPDRGALKIFQVLLGILGSGTA